MICSVFFWDGSIIVIFKNRIFSQNWWIFEYVTQMRGRLRVPGICADAC